MVFNLDLEKQVLGGLIKHPQAYPEVASFIGEGDFYYSTNKIIFSIIRAALDNRQEISSLLVTTRLQNLNISFKDNINPADYVDSFTYIQITPKGLIQAVADLKVVTQRREFAEVSEQIRKKMISDGSMNYDDINSWVDKKLYSKINSYYNAGDCIDLFETMFDRAEERANNPIEEVGIPTPYPTFNAQYGGLLPGNVYVFCARPKQGKTTMLNSTAFEMANRVENKLPCLILDTEMQEDEVGDRLLSKVSGVPTWYLRTGNWNKNAELREKYWAAKKQFQNEKWNLHHEYVINTPIEQIISKIKRWYYTKVGRGNPCMIVYDYIKITGEGLSDFNKEHQVIGDKVNRLKELVGKEVNAPLLTAVQLNRSGVDRGGAPSDDASAIALSDRVLWFASYVGIFRRKTLQETADYGTTFGTHSLVHVESRWQGKEAAGHSDFVKNHKGEVVRNFTNFSLENFNVKEIGSAEDMFNKLGGNVDLQQDPPADPFE